MIYLFNYLCFYMFDIYICCYYFPICICKVQYFKCQQMLTLNLAVVKMPDLGISRKFFTLLFMVVNFRVLRGVELLATPVAIGISHKKKHSCEVLILEKKRQEK